MKKYIVGFLVGVIMASTVPAYAAVSSMIGKEVQAENTVVVNGKELDVKSVNIGGTTYTPNRALADALGMEIKFEDNTVIFEEKVETMEEPRITEQPAPAPTDNQTELDQINARISEISKAEREYLAKRNQLMIDSMNNNDKREEIQKESAEIDAEITKLLEEKKRLEARRTELQSQQTP